MDSIIASFFAASTASPATLPAGAGAPIDPMPSLLTFDRLVSPTIGEAGPVGPPTAVPSVALGQAAAPLAMLLLLGPAAAGERTGLVRPGAVGADADPAAAMPAAGGSVSSALPLTAEPVPSSARGPDRSPTSGRPLIAGALIDAAISDAPARPIDAAPERDVVPPAISVGDDATVPDALGDADRDAERDGPDGADAQPAGAVDALGGTPVATVTAVPTPSAEQIAAVNTVEADAVEGQGEPTATTVRDAGDARRPTPRSGRIAAAGPEERVAPAQVLAAASGDAVPQAAMVEGDDPSAAPTAPAEPEGRPERVRATGSAAIASDAGPAIAADPVVASMVDPMIAASALQPAKDGGEAFATPAAVKRGAVTAAESLSANRAAEAGPARASDPTAPDLSGPDLAAPDLSGQAPVASDAVAPGSAPAAGTAFAAGLAVDGPAAPAGVPDAPVVAARAGRMGHDMGVAIARHVAIGGGETIAIRLDPADMGRIEVRLSFNDGGALQAVVAADNPASLDLLRRESPELVRALADAGVSADAGSFRFDTRSGGQGGQSQHRHPAFRAQPDRMPVEEDAVAAAYQPLRTRGRVDLMA